MWIKRKNCEAVNANHIESIFCNYNNKNYYIKFFLLDGFVSYQFETKEEMETYYEALLITLDAKEIEIIKL